jgi:hypothetical protein
MCKSGRSSIAMPWASDWGRAPTSALINCQVTWQYSAVRRYLPSGERQRLTSGHDSGNAGLLLRGRGHTAFANQRG